MPNRIILKRSSVAAKTPVAADLSAGELAINLSDKRLFSKDGSGNIINVTVDASHITTGTLADARIASAATWNAKEPGIAAGTTAQYWRGDKSWQTLNSTAVGLGNVENKSSATIRGEITSANVTTALGFTPYSATNPSGYITSSGSISGNAATATALQTARTINGTSFNGSANIDTTEWYHSDRDYPSGTLITTSINYAVTNGDPFVIEIRGNSYGNIVPLDLIYQGYIYSDTIINHGGLSNGVTISGMVALNVGGNLCFWFPSQGYWQGYNVRVYAAYASRPTNRVTSITGGVKPSGTKEVALSANIRQSLHSSNYTSYSPSLTGSGASGTWGISITGSAASITGTYGGTLTSSQVTTALGFAPYNSSNPSGYTSNTGTVTSVTGTGTVSGLTLTGAVTTSGSLTLGGTLSLTSANVTGGLGYTPLSNTGGTISGSLNVTGNITVSSSNATGGGIILADDGDIVDLNDGWASMRFSYGVRIYSANKSGSAVISLGNNGIVTASQFTGSGAGLSSSTVPIASLVAGDYSSKITSGSYSISITGSAASITGTYGGSLTSSQVTTALGFTPYNSTNPNGYTSNTGTVTSVAGAGTVSGLTLTGTVTTSGSLTLGGTLSLTSANVTGGLGYTPANKAGETFTGSVTFNQNIYVGVSTAVDPSNVGGFAAGQITEGTTGFSAAGICIGNGAGQHGAIVYGSGTMYFGTENGSDNTMTTRATLSSAGTFNATNITVNGSQSLHAGNYTSYSPSLTGSGASGTWGINVTGNAATATTTDNINGRAFLNRDSGNSLGQDSYTSNGVGYVTGVSLFSQTDGGFYASAYNTSWVHQIFGDFRTGQIAVRGKNNGTWQYWRAVLDSGNYSSYALPLSGGTTTGHVTFNSTTTFNYTPTVNAYLNCSQWFNITGGAGYGLYGNGTNGAHFYLNSGSYGPWKILGTRNGWSGIEFGSLSYGDVTLMIGTNSNSSGFHNNTYGWHFYWGSGTIWMSTSTYGGGSLSAVLNSSNWGVYIGASNLGLGSGNSVTFYSVSDSIGNLRTIVQNYQTAAYTLAATDSGKHIRITTGGVTVPNGVFSAGQAITIYNDSGSNQTITQGASVTMYLGGTATTGNRTLAQRGVATLLCIDSSTFVISGAGLT